MEVILLFKFFYKILPTKPQERLSFFNLYHFKCNPLIPSTPPSSSKNSHPSKTAVFGKVDDPFMSWEGSDYDPVEIWTICKTTFTIFKTGSHWRTRCRKRSFSFTKEDQKKK